MTSLTLTISQPRSYCDLMEELSSRARECYNDFPKYSTGDDLGNFILKSHLGFSLKFEYTPAYVTIIIKRRPFCKDAVV